MSSAKESLALAYADGSMFFTAGIVFLVTIVGYTIWTWVTYTPPLPPEYQCQKCGDITMETLEVYDGRDWLKPIYFAVRGKVYDVTPGKDFYGPGTMPNSKKQSFFKVSLCITQWLKE